MLIPLSLIIYTGVSVFREFFLFNGNSSTLGKHFDGDQRRIRWQIRRENVTFNVDLARETGNSKYVLVLWKYNGGRVRANELDSNARMMNRVNKCYGLAFVSR